EIISPHSGISFRRKHKCAAAGLIEGCLFVIACIDRWAKINWLTSRPVIVQRRKPDVEFARTARTIGSKEQIFSIGCAEWLFATIIVDIYSRKKGWRTPLPVLLYSII